MHVLSFIAFSLADKKIHIYIRTDKETNGRTDKAKTNDYPNPPPPFR